MSLWSTDQCPWFRAKLFCTTVLLNLHSANKYLSDFFFCCCLSRLSAMPFEVVLVNFVVRPSASQVLLSCAGHHLAHNTLILNDFTFINYFWFSSFITTHGRTPGYCLLWRFRFNVPCERSLKGFLHICKLTNFFFQPNHSLTFVFYVF